MNKFATQLGPWVVRYRWGIIVATMLAVFAAASGMRFLTITNDTRVFFSKKNPQLRALQAFEDTYSKDNNVFFAIAPKDGQVFTRRTLGAIEALTEASWKMPYSGRVDSIVNFQHTRADGDDLIVEDLVQNAEELSAADVQRIKRIALSEPLLVRNLISPSGHVAGVNVTVTLPGKSLTEVPEATAFARKLADDFRQKHPDIDIHLIGSVISDNAFGEASQKDMSTVIPVMFVVLLVIVGVALRSFTGTLVTLAVIVFSMVTGLGLAGLIGITITAASVNAPTLILTLAVADSVHLLSTMFKQMRLGKSKHEAIAESVRVNLQAVFLTSATTAIGFLSMNFSDVPPFRDLGNIVAIGVMAAFFYSVLFLPALAVVLPMRVKALPESTDRVCCGWLANLVVTRHRLVFWSTLAVIVVLSAGILRIEFNETFYKYFDERNPYRRASDFVLENLRGLDVIEYSLDSGEPGGINDPDYLGKAEAFADWYRQQPSVTHVYTISATLKRLNKNMHGDDASFYRIPEQRELAAQYLLLYEMSLPFGLDLNNRINVDKSATRMTVTLSETSTTGQREIDEKGARWLDAHEMTNITSSGTGLSLIWAHITERNIRSMLAAIFWALVLISGILMLALRSFKLGLLSLLPNLTPALMAFGVWGLTVGQVGLGLSIVMSMTIGIVVDDTVHFLSKYLRARREHDMTPSDAVRYSFNTVGTAMWVTTVALVVGFMVLTLSSYKMSSDMGLMSAITIALALGMDFLLLPTLLIMVEERPMKKEHKPKKQMLSIFAMLLLLAPLATSAETPEERGLAIAQEADQRDAGFGNSTAKMRMILKNRHGQESTREIRIKTMEVQDDGDKSLMVFDTPRDVKGTAFLNFTHKTDDDDQWLYLPALKRVKRISSRNKSGSFMGSEFAYEDIASQEVEKYTYKWMRDEALDGRECFVVEYYPADTKNSGYTRQVTWIDQDTFRPWQVEYYDRKESLLKTLSIKGYEQYLDRYWRASEMNMVNHQNGKSTKLLLTEYKFRVGLKDSDFTQNSLKRVR